MQLSRKHRALLFISYAIVITVLSLLPANTAPSFGIWDKVQHFSAYLLFMVLAFPLAHWHRWRLLTAAGIIAYSVVMEYAQRLSPGRQTSWEDVFANSLGVAAGYLLAWGLLYSIKCFRKNDSQR